MENKNTTRPQHTEQNTAIQSLSSETSHHRKPNEKEKGDNNKKGFVVKQTLGPLLKD